MLSIDIMMMIGLMDRYVFYSCDNVDSFDGYVCFH